MYSHQYPGVHDEDQLLRAACASSVRKACAKRTARFTRAAGCNRNLTSAHAPFPNDTQLRQ